MRYVLLMLLFSLLAGEMAFADTVELGRQIQVDGQIIREKPHLVLEVDSELRLALPDARIRKKIKTSELGWYQDAAAAAGDDAELHYQLARKCKEKGLLAQRDFHFERVIEIEPDHSKARQALGYARDGDRWIPRDDLQRKRGLILAGGKWQVPEVYAQAKASEEANKQASLYKKELARYRSSILRGDKRSQDSMQSLEQMNDPLAARAFAEALAESRGKDAVPRSLRKLFVRKLGSFRVPTAVNGLVVAGLADPDAEIRTLALKELQEYGAPVAVASYLQLLRGNNPSPSQVTAALRALLHFPDQELWREYVDALSTSHEKLVAPGAGMNVGFGSNGGGGLGIPGNKPKKIVSSQQNPEAIELLKEIAPGVDYRYDEKAWREYFADQLIGSPGDLRRDP